METNHPRQFGESNLVGCGDTFMKTCSKCKETKNLNDFHIARLNRDKHRGVCKKCRVKDGKFKKASKLEQLKFDAVAKKAMREDRAKHLQFIMNRWKNQKHKWEVEHAS